MVSRTLLDQTAARALARPAFVQCVGREHLLRYIENPDEIGSALDPLDDDQHSPWNTLRQDEEIRAEIFQDVERCMPEEPYFRHPDTQRIMLDVLFIFCKINQDVGYRQGMHELLAPILWAVEKDAIEYGSDHDAKLEPDTLLEQILDPSYIEHDAFTLLSLIMRTAKSFYELGEPDRAASPQLAGIGAPPQGASPIVERSKRIHEVYLAHLDPALAKHLTDIEVLPQIFLIRWIRLLFGREFPFDELLELWDVILAEDPALDLVDMVCVSMLLRIRWQLIEANYSVALMLLLKYPAPSPPNGPQSFVDDAIFLRDNFNAAGGAAIISKYSGKSPAVFASDSRPVTPLGQGFSPRQRLSRTMSPLPSPARFLQQQGGVEALLRGAAKGVFDQGERLGINQAVRDAAGEVKKNMQGLQTSRPNSLSRRTSEAPRWSLDEGRSIPSARMSIVAVNNRNQQLAKMLQQAVSDLRVADISREAMDIACAKVDFVRVYLEDSTMPLPIEEPVISNPSPSPPVATPQSPPQPPLEPEIKISPAKSVSTTAPSTKLKSSSPKIDAVQENDLTIDKLKVVDEVPKSPPASNSTSGLDVPGASLSRPRAPVPTRSTIANSSFSWMLEPDNSPGSTLKSSPPKSSSPFLRAGRKPAAGPSRDKTAFLFGEDGGENKTSNRSPILADIDEGFNLTNMKQKDT